MAKLIYNIESKDFSLLENDRDKQLSNSKDIFSSRQYCAFFNPEEDFDQIYRLLALFGIDDTNISKCKPIDDYWIHEKDLIIAENVNPYVMKLNWRCVVYFGNDMPVVKSKTVKTMTKHYQQWTGNKIYKKPEPETYFYVEVKEKDKLFFFYSCHYDFINGERLTEFNEKNIEVSLYPNRENFDYIARLDYTDETFNLLLNEKIEKEKQEREEKQRRARELEIRKATDGYCDCCGEPAEYVADPFQREYGYTRMSWLCRDCFYNMLREGDI